MLAEAEVIRFACIVEGHGEEQALPVLLRRILAEHRPSLDVDVARPLRVARGRILKERELERAVELMARRVVPQGALLILFDADDDCPAKLGPQVLERARKIRADLPVGVVLANREFESWFLAGARSLRGARGLGGDLEPPGAAEVIRDAKGWLTARRVDGRSYVETLDQAALAARLSLEEARSASSFGKLVRDVLCLVDQAAAIGTPVLHED
jgi:hypothetical protein